MKRFVLSYYEIGECGERIIRKEVFRSKLAAKINLFFSMRNGRRCNHILKVEEI